jgi:hypothetical protein
VLIRLFLTVLDLFNIILISFFALFVSEQLQVSPNSLVADFQCHTGEYNDEAVNI